MGLRTKVVVTEVNNLSDARYCAGMGVDIIGFLLDESHPRYVSPTLFQELTGWVAGVQLFGEFSKSDGADLIQRASGYELDGLIVDHADVLDELNDRDLPVILKLSLSERNWEAIGELMERHRHQASEFLLTFDEGNESLLQRAIVLAKKFPVILGAGVTNENVNVLVDESDIKGIALKGTEEIKPGYKDYDELSDILESLEIDD